MAVVTASLIASASRVTGFDPAKRVRNFAKNIFGKKERNKGNASLVDALDNYEKVSSGLAREMEPIIIEMILTGASERQIADYIATQIGDKDGKGIYTSWKWDIVSDYINEISRLNPAQPPTPVKNPANKNVTQSFGIPTQTIIIAVGSISVFIFALIKFR